MEFASSGFLGLIRRSRVVLSQVSGNMWERGGGKKEGWMITGSVDTAEAG